MGNKRIISNLIILCTLFSMIFLCGCTKQKSNYVPEATFEYNNSQESVRLVEKPTEENTEETTEEEQEELAEHSLGYTEQGESVVMMDTYMEGSVVMPMTTMPSETHELTPEDMPANDDISVDESEKENTEAPQEDNIEEPNTENIVPDSPIVEPVTTEAVIEEPVTTEAQPEVQPEVEPDNNTDELSTSTDASENVPTEGGETPDDTNESGADSGTGGDTNQGEPTDNQGDSSQVTPNPDDSNTSDTPDTGDSNLGNGEAGDGEEGDSGTGEEAGGNESGDNDTGNSSEGDGGSGDGGTGTGGDNNQGDGDTSEEGLGGDPTKIDELRYEGSLGEYIWGEPVDTSDLTVYAKFGDGREEVVTDYTVYMNYPDRTNNTVGDPSTWQYVYPYIPGEYNATISYGGKSIYCPYNLNIIFVAVTLGHVSPCRNIEEHSTGRVYDPDRNAIIVNSFRYDDFTDYYYCGITKCAFIDEDGSHITGSYNHVLIPLYYDYTFTVSGDLMVDSYSISEIYDLSSAKVLGSDLAVYKNNVDIKDYKGLVYSEIRIIYDDLKEVGAYWR